MIHQQIVQRLNHISTSRVLVVGDLMLDGYVQGRIDRVSPEAPVPVICQEKQSWVMGGAANVCNNLIHQGAQAHLIAVVGADDLHCLDVCINELSDSLKASFHVDLVPEKNRQTTRKTRFMAQGQQVMRWDQEDTHCILPETQKKVLELSEKAFQQFKPQVLIISDYNKGVVSETLCETLCRLARSYSIEILVDPKKSNFKAYQYATALTPNLVEYNKAFPQGALAQQELTEREKRQSLHQGMQSMKSEFPYWEALIVTQGGQGLSLLASEQSTSQEEGDDHSSVIHIPTQAQEVYDVSGAGDTLIGMIASARASGATWYEAAQLGTLAAAVSVRKAQTYAPSRWEIERYSQEITQLDLKRIPTEEDLLLHVQRLQNQGVKVGFTNGCFDLVHYGHLSLLSQARLACDFLVVGVNSDRSVKQLKGPSRPLVTEQERAALLLNLHFVDAVVIFDEETPLKLIKKLKPQVLVKGSDYTIDQVVGAQEVQAQGGEVLLVQLTKDRSTSQLVEAIHQQKKH